jgi:hypothetical protein
MNTLETTLHLILAEMQYTNDMTALALMADAKDNGDDDLLRNVELATANCYAKYGNPALRRNK